MVPTASHFAGVLGLGLALTLMSTPAQAQITTNGPYYATPSWDQTLPQSIRYVVLTNFGSDAVLDRETGLVWQRTPGGSTTWTNASEACLTITTGHRGGWRLPSVHELASVFDLSVTTTTSLFVNGSPFNSGPSGRYWTATPSTGGGHHLIQYGTNVFGRVFYFLNLSDDDNQFAGYWCVRGGGMSGTQ
jgi:hypothetical protein